MFNFFLHFLLTETEGLISVPPVLFLKLDLLPQFFLLCLGSNVESQSLLLSQIFIYRAVGIHCFSVLLNPKQIRKVRAEDNLKIF